MGSQVQIHWHEGLFLQPHHLQGMQRQLMDEIAGYRLLSRPYAYGVAALQLSEDALSNYHIQIDRLHVIMPSGAEIVFPDNADLASVSIKEAMAGANALTVSLGIPRWRASGANALGSSGADELRSKRRYHVVEVQRLDENTGENPQPIQVRRINARLVLPGDDTSDLEVLPLLKVIRSAEGAGLPVRDAGFVPPTVILEGAPALQRLVRDLAQHVLACRTELALQMTREELRLETLRGSQFENFLLLRTLSRYGAVLQALCETGRHTSPLDVYLQLRGFLGELSALHPEQDLFEAASYDHDNPAPAFQELGLKIRSAMGPRTEQGPVRVRFQKSADGMCRIATLDETLTCVPNEYFLAIKTGEDPGALRQLVEDDARFKLMPHSWIDQLRFGVKLAYEPHPPMPLPTEVGLHYFRLQRDKRPDVWEQVRQDKALAVRWPDMENGDYDVSLLMTIPS